MIENGESAGFTDFVEKEGAGSHQTSQIPVLTVRNLFIIRFQEFRQFVRMIEQVVGDSEGSSEIQEMEMMQVL